MANTIVKVCPECGVSMAERSPEAHALSHYPEYLDPARSSKKARQNQKLILEGGVTPAQYEKMHKEVDE